MNICFRVSNDLSTGRGHEKRCTALANALSELNHNIIFISDVETLEPQSADANYLIQTENNDSLISICLKQCVDILIYDSYSLSASQEQELHRLCQQNNIRFVVFSDHPSSHSADLEINFHRQANFSNQEPLQKIELKGPEYYPIKKPKKTRTSKELKSLLIHAGGSGLFSRAPEQFMQIAQQALKAKLDVFVLCPTDTSTNFWTQKARPFNQELQLLEVIPNLADHLHKFDLVIGPSGHSTYESLAAGCITISFDMFGDGRDDPDTWAYIGHILHLSYVEFQQVKTIKNLLKEVLNNIKLVETQNQKIADFFQQYGSSYLAMKIVSDDLRMQSDSRITVAAHEVMPCSDDLIWTWLDSRNAEENRSVSTNAEVIDRVNHRMWWLNKNIKRFVLITNGQLAAFFWHREFNFSGQQYLIGGWFPMAGRKASILEATKIVKYQLEKVMPQYPRAKWLASIRDHNKAIITLNTILGFRRGNCLDISAAECAFPGTNAKEFEILTWESYAQQ
jgi:spore coat polysaccharide biosynthesis predicted glycosyltransferase SpsG